MEVGRYLWFSCASSHPLPGCRFSPPPLHYNTSCYHIIIYTGGLYPTGSISRQYATFSFPRPASVYQWISKFLWLVELYYINQSHYQGFPLLSGASNDRVGSSAYSLYLNFEHPRIFSLTLRCWASKMSWDMATALRVAQYNRQLWVH
jgi:hypothetical protein